MSAGLTCAFLMMPVFVVVPMSFSTSPFLQFPPPGFGFEYYSQFFGDAQWHAALILSAEVALGAMVVAVVVGTMAAYALVRGRLKACAALEAVFMLPLIVPTIIFGAGAYLVELRVGLVGNTLILILAHAVLALPFVVVNVGAALRATDHRLALVAQTMGASPVAAFREVTLPLIRPAMVTAALLTLIISLDETVVALFLTQDTNPTVPVDIYNTIQYQLDPIVPVAATVILAATVVVGGAVLASRRVAAAASERQRHGSGAGTMARLGST